MEVQPKTATSKGPVERFTGDVWVDMITLGPAAITAAMVRFAPGAHTAWHRHALGQTLHVTEGLGFVQARGGPAVAIRPGDTIWTPPGEWHWHGAAADRFMCHLALSDTEGAPDEVEWGGHLTDQEYREAGS
jgi:quercetin dioxygenase-like cupin family protein